MLNFRVATALGVVGAFTVLAAPVLAQTQAASPPSAPVTDGPVATAPTSGPGAPVAAPASTTSVRSVQGDAKADTDIADDRKPHGYVQVGVGNHGYRQVSGAVTVPVGDDGQATIAVDDEQATGVRRR